MFIDNRVTRLNDGVTNEDVGSIFNSLKFPSHLGSHYFEEDFYTFTAAQWTETDVSGANTVAIAEGDGGLITLLTAGADDNEVALQRIAAVVQERLTMTSTRSCPWGFCLRVRLTCRVSRARLHGGSRRMRHVVCSL